MLLLSVFCYVESVLLVTLPYKQTPAETSILHVTVVATLSQRETFSHDPQIMFIVGCIIEPSHLAPQ